jgi:hypothetical protein
MRRIAVLLSALPLALGAALVAAEDMNVDATIQSVNRDDHSVTVEFDETGATQTFRIDDDTKITFESNPESALRNGVRALPSGLEDLRAGQNVTLRFDENMKDGEWVIVHYIVVS